MIEFGNKTLFSRGIPERHERKNKDETFIYPTEMMKWEAEEKGYDCNDCYLSMQNCHDISICCEDETGLCDQFEEMPDMRGNQDECTD